MMQISVFSQSNITFKFNPDGAHHMLHLSLSQVYCSPKRKMMAWPAAEGKIGPL